MDSAAVRAKLLALPSAIERTAQAELLEIAQATLAAALPKVPVDTGELSSSGAVGPVEKGFSVFFASEHALYVHERTDIAHDQGQSKFLEAAYLEVLPTVQARLAKAAESAIRSV